MSERVHVLNRLGPGDWVFVANDRRTLWRLARDEGEGWSVWRFRGVVGVDLVGDWDDWSRWDCCASHLPTRREAEAEALRITSP